MAQTTPQPEVTAFSLQKKDQFWYVVQYTIKGKRVLKEEDVTPGTTFADALDRCEEAIIRLKEIQINTL